MISIDYLAGFMDGEGSICIATHRKARNPGYYLRVQISNTDRGVLESIQKSFGGGIYTTKKGNGWRSEHQLVWCSRKGAALLKELFPYLILKRERAGLAIAFMDYLRSWRPARGHKGRILPVTDADLNLRKRFYEHMKQLNIRGGARKGESGDRK